MLREVFLHLLPRGHCKRQEFPTGKATPVVADDDVIEECVIIFDNIHAYGAGLENKMHMVQENETCVGYW